MNNITKVLLCVFEMLFITTLCMSLPFTLIGVMYPMFYSPTLGIISIFGAGILGADMVVRACDGVGMVW